MLAKWVEEKDIADRKDYGRPLISGLDARAGARGMIALHADAERMRMMRSSRGVSRTSPPIGEVRLGVPAPGRRPHADRSLSGLAARSCCTSCPYRHSLTAGCWTWCQRSRRALMFPCRSTAWGPVIAPASISTARDDGEASNPLARGRTPVLPQARKGHQASVGKRDWLVPGPILTAPPTPSPQSVIEDAKWLDKRMAAKNVPDRLATLRRSATRKSPIPAPHCPAFQDRPPST
jgi:hypothetical protein